MSDKMPKNYKEAVEYIEDLPRFTKKHSLEHTQVFLKRLGNPGFDRKVIHVAGTNGKGSVCAYLQAVLAAEDVEAMTFWNAFLILLRRLLC